jgi:PRTRC genetic system protein C
MTDIQRPIRVFRINGTTLPDVDPRLPPEAVLATYEANYPMLRGATLDEPRMENGTLVYTVLKPPAQTKGRGKPARDPAPASASDLDAALAALDAWAATDTPRVPARWAAVYQHLQQAKPARLDPFLIPLA